MLVEKILFCFFFFSSRRRHTRFDCDWSSDVCSSDLQLNGTVTDQSGAAVANAKVTVVNRATNLGVTVLTSPAGQYRIFNLLPSLYDLTIEAPGFKTVQIAGLKINVDQTLTQDSVLSLGSVAEKVEVSAQADLLERTTVSESTVIQDKVIQDL